MNDKQEAKVNGLLAESRAAHARYRRAANPRIEGEKPNYREAEAHVAEAMKSRAQAHKIDPLHEASGWALDRVAHDELMEFYRRYPEIP